jgi:hypothetical protein
VNNAKPLSIIDPSVAGSGSGTSTFAQAVTRSWVSHTEKGSGWAKFRQDLGFALKIVITVIAALICPPLRASPPTRPEYVQACLDAATCGYDMPKGEFEPYLKSCFDWIPLPAFNFRVWITGLSYGVPALLGLSPLVFAGSRLFRIVAYFLGVLMVANAIGHIGASLYWGKLVPDIYSSPILLVAALALLIMTYTTRRGQEQVSSGSR